MWVARAARIVEGAVEDAEAIDAAIGLARNAFETAALEVVALAQKAIGLKSLLLPDPLERLIHDLTIYLRHPKPRHLADVGRSAPSSLGETP